MREIDWIFLYFHSGWLMEKHETPIFWDDEICGAMTDWRPDWPHCDGEAEQWPDLGGELPLLLQRRRREREADSWVS